MKPKTLERSALVITPSPHIPREYGNRNRVFQTISFLKSFGYAVSCLLYPFDEEWERTVPPYYSELTAEFDYFAVIPNSKKLHQAAAEYHHQIDEWWDENIGHHLTWLFQRKRFDLLFVNYTFFSKAFEYAPKGVFRLLDTHDLFTGRRETFERFGVKPEFFYTNAQEEKKAFDRADAVIAIKDSERQLLRTMTDKPVISLPYWDRTAGGGPSASTLDERHFSHETPLRVGFIGAQNSVNTVNICKFLQKMARYIAFYNAPVVISVAGNVCRQIDLHYTFLEKLGRVEHITTFYRNIDAVIAPLEFSTGIKIKVGEALAWQLPVLATHNAFDGFQAFHPTQSEASVDAVCTSIVRLAFNEISYKQITLAARRSARAADKAQEAGFEQLRKRVRDSSGKILFITDRPFWHRATHVDELVAQAVEYVSNIASTIVINLCGEQPGPTAISPTISYVDIPSEESFGEWLTDTTVLFRAIGSIDYLCNVNAPGYRTLLADHSIHNWNLCIGSTAIHQPASVVLADETRSNSITLSALRYAPLKCRMVFRVPGIVIWHSSQLSEWEELMMTIIEDMSFRAGLTVTKALVPEYAEFNTSFFSRSISDTFDRWILLRQDNVAETFLLYTAQYLDIRTLMLSEQVACPEDVFQSQLSVSKSVRTFIEGKSRVQYAGGSNSGWETLWQEMEKRLKTSDSSAPLKTPIRQFA